MNRRAFLAMMLPASLVASASTDGTLDRELLLSCIAAVESGGRDGVVGRDGERSKYQIGYSVWQQHAPKHLRNRAAHARWCNGLVADALARQHFKWIVRCVGANPHAIVASWHLGVAGQRRPWNKRAQDHVARTIRLYRSLGGK